MEHSYVRYKKYIIILTVIAVVIGITAWRHNTQPFVKAITAEADAHSIKWSDYLKDANVAIDVIKDLSNEEWRTPGTHKMLVNIDGKKVKAPVKIIDTTPPVIKGVKNINVEVGSTVSYRKGITLSDNAEGAINLDINHDQVDLNKIGHYTVEYVASDIHHNQTTKKATITVHKKYTKVEKAHLQTLDRARKMVRKLTKPTDSKARKLYKVFVWCRDCPYYTYRDFTKSYKKGWPSVYADDLFIKGRGNCHSAASAFAYMAVVLGYKVTLKRDSVTTKNSHSWAVINGRVYDPTFAHMKTYGMKRSYKITEKKYHLYAKSSVKLTKKKCW